MSIVIIVNIILSVSLLLGGLCMKKIAVSPGDHSIGFKTKRAVQNDDAWYYANTKSGIVWIIVGIAGFVLTGAGIIIQALRNESNGALLQLFALIAQFSSVIISSMLIDNQLKNKYDDHNDI